MRLALIGIAFCYVEAFAPQLRTTAVQRPASDNTPSPPKAVLADPLVAEPSAEDPLAVTQTSNEPGLLDLGVTQEQAQRRRSLYRRLQRYGSLEQRCLAEAAGTAWIVAVCALASGILGLSSTAMALVAGTAVGTAVLAFSGVSGAHFNPAVTLALVAGKKFRAVDAPAYVASQFTAAALASVAVSRCLGGLGAVAMPALAPTMSAEATVTAILVFVCFAVGDAVEVGRVPKHIAPLLIGCLITGLTLAFGDLRVAINPAMAFAPRLVAALVGWGRAALAGGMGYLIGPCVGGLLGGSLFALASGRGEGLYRGFAQITRFYQRLATAQGAAVAQGAPRVATDVPQLRVVPQETLPPVPVPVRVPMRGVVVPTAQGGLTNAPAADGW